VVRLYDRDSRPVSHLKLFTSLLSCLDELLQRMAAQLFHLLPLLLLLMSRVLALTLVLVLVIPCSYFTPLELCRAAD